jgi:hypothetical protein
VHLNEPRWLFGVRCDVTRDSDPVARVAEALDVGLYGIHGDPSFDYPSAFQPSYRSTPAPGEACEMTWYVKAAEGGEWLLAAAAHFPFGEWVAQPQEPSATSLGQTPSDLPESSAEAI